MRKSKQNQNTRNPALLNIVTPMGMEFKRTSLNIGEFIGKILGVTKYPPIVETGWLAKVSNTPGTVISQTFMPADNTLLVESISKNIMQNRSIAQSTRDPLTQKRAERGIEDGEHILTQIDQNGETVGYMTNLVMPIDNDEKRFEKLCRRVEGLYSSIRCKIRPLPNLQKEAFKMLSPYHVPQQKIIDITQRIVPLSTFIGGFPFASSGYNDGDGTWFAMDAHGGMVVLDLWKREGDRTNSNIVILGHSGQGKSTAIKNIILSEYMMGTKVILLDPEAEYKELCHNLGGDWINCAGGEGGMINPLQVKPAPRDDDGETDRLYTDEGNGMGDLALHMKTLDIFFNLYLPSLTDIQKALLKDTLIHMYADYNITWETDINDRKPEEFPTFTDLYNLLKQRAEISKKEDYDVLIALLSDISVGSDSFLWNGITTIKTNSKIICLDTHELQNTEDKIKRTQYFNILSWAWEQMSRDRTEKVRLVADEAYLMIDPNVPQSLVFLRNVSKRARKYEAAISIISHSLVDFLDPSVRMYGQPLLDMPSYKVIMGCDGRDLEDIISLYHLTDSEQELVYSKRRGHALCMIGSKRLHIWFLVPEYKMNLIGKGGGR